MFGEGKFSSHVYRYKREHGCGEQKRLLCYHGYEILLIWKFGFKVITLFQVGFISALFGM